jgi:hypothetical protein
MTNLGYMGAGFMLVILLPIIGLFVALPIALILIFMVLVWPGLFIIYLFTKSPILANILGPTFFLFLGLVIGFVVLYFLDVVKVIA